MTDREAILDVIARYAHTVDGRDLDGILTCFAPDGRIDFEGGLTSGEGHDGIRAAFAEAFTQPALAPPAVSTHLMANTLVTIDGDTARAETQGVAYLASPVTGTVRTRGLRYRDVLRRDEAAGASPTGSTARSGRRKRPVECTTTDHRLGHDDLGRPSASAAANSADRFASSSSPAGQTWSVQMRTSSKPSSA